MTDQLAERYLPVKSARESAGGFGHTHQGCTDCGSIVFDTERHDEWHAEVEETSRAASRADGRTRGIG